MPEGIGYSDLKNKKVNFPVIGTVSIVTAGVIAIAAALLLSQTKWFRGKPATKRANISYEY